MKYSASYKIWTIFTIYYHARSLILCPFGHRAILLVTNNGINVLWCRGFHLTVLQKVCSLIDLDSPHHKRSVLIDSFFIHSVTEPHSQRSNEILRSEYNFAVNVVMVINITIHKVFISHDLFNKLLNATITSIERTSM